MYTKPLLRFGLCIHAARWGTCKMMKYRIIIIILAMVITSCSFEDNQNNMTAIQDKFTWNIQKAGYDTASMMKKEKLFMKSL